MEYGNDLVIATPERWDEACFSIPFIRALAAAGRIKSLVCHERQEAFWLSSCDVPLILFSDKTSTGALAKILGDDFHVSIAWEMGVPAKAFAKAKIATRLGPEGKEYHKLGKLLTEKFDLRGNPGGHRIEFYLKMAVEIGVAVDHREFFAPANHGISPESGTCILCPGSDFGPSHEWSEDRWYELATTLLAEGKKLTIIGAIGGRGLGQRLSEKLGSRAAFTCASPLATSLPIFGKHALTITADGSVAHLAAHAGSRCIVLFGPNDPVWKRPLGKQHLCISHHAECSPCLSPTCEMDRRCQNELTVEKVLRVSQSGE